MLCLGGLRKTGRALNAVMPHSSLLSWGMRHTLVVMAPCSKVSVLEHDDQIPSMTIVKCFVREGLSDSPLDILGNHKSACAVARMLGRRGFAVELAWICREAGAKVSTNVLVRKLDLPELPGVDAMRLEMVGTDLLRSTVSSQS